MMSIHQLNQRSDWSRWLNDLESWAKFRGIWQYIDPSSDSELRQPDLPSILNDEESPEPKGRNSIRIRSKRSSISFEIWLPADWDEKKRFVATSNGGVDGCVKYKDLAYGAANRFALVGTNNGHNGTTAVDMLNNPDVIKDFSYRTLYIGTKYGKKLVEKFYAKKYKHLYYISCSLGGCIGISAADKYPEDFDGIVAGALAVDFLHMNDYRANFFTITGGPDSDNYIPITT
ncbi:hypothetical protein ARSEF1564_009860 [Beauveria bassiana]